jgi:hypothetical protein
LTQARLGEKDIRGLHTPESWRRMIDLPGVPAMPVETLLLNAANRPADCRAIRLPAYRPTFGSASELVQVVGEFAKSEIEVIEFSGVDLGPDDAVTWARQAVRYARRALD